MSYNFNYRLKNHIHLSFLITFDLVFVGQYNFNYFIFIMFWDFGLKLFLGHY